MAKEATPLYNWSKREKFYNKMYDYVLWVIVIILILALPLAILIDPEVPSCG